MSLIVGLCCPEGVILAADSCMTHARSLPELSLAAREEKIRRVDGQPFVYGAAGTLSGAQHMHIAMDEAPLPDDSISALRRDLMARLPRHCPPSERSVSVLLGGIVSGAACLVEAAPDADLVHATPGAIAMIGSGRLVAEPLLALYRGAARTLEEAAVLALWVTTEAIDQAAAYLKPPAVVWRVRRDGTVRRLDAGELRDLERRVATWRKRDLAALARVARARRKPRPMARLLPEGVL